MKKEDIFIKTSIPITALVVFVFLIYALLIGSKAVYDSVFILFLLLMAYIFHERLNIKPLPMALAELFFFLHMFGTVGWYDKFIFGIPYDKILHFYGPLVLFIFVFNYLSRFELGLTHKLGFALLITLGIDAVQEVVEFTGNTLLGSGEGLFFYGSGDIGGQDTPKDLIANLLGGLLALIIIFFKTKIKRE